MPDDNVIDGLAALRAARAKPKPSDNPNEALSGTEDEVALEFSRRYEDEFRYVKLWNSWLRWNGTVWHRVQDLSVFHLVRALARAYSKIYEDKRLGKDAATTAIERAARNDPRHDRLPDLWDPDLEFFNTPDRER